MANGSPARRDGVDGLALFAAVGFVLGLGLIYALERVGAPDAFVEALGPILTLTGLCVIGMVARAPNLPEFLAAGRGIPTFYAGLAFAAAASGLIVAMLSGLQKGGEAPWRGVGLGVIAAAAWVAPLWRGQNASALADVLATRFPSWPSRLVFTWLLAAIGMLTAIAGFDLAADALAPTFNLDPRAARGLVMLALAVSVTPGGLKGLLWTNAGSAGAALLIGAIGVSLRPDSASASLAIAGEAWRDVLALPAFDLQGLWTQLSTALAVAFFFALSMPAIGAGSASRARRGGLFGLAFVGLGLALATIALPNPTGAACAPHTAAALTVAAAWLPALALARAGVLGTARARGINLATGHATLIVLASRRIAISRAAALIVIALCPYAREVSGLDAGRAIYLALAIGLAMVTPSLLLALVPRVSSGAAGWAIAASLGTAAARVYVSGGIPANSELMAVAGVAGTVGLVVGGGATLLFPSRQRRESAIADPFARSPLSAKQK
jgi:hypothetical protein